MMTKIETKIEQKDGETRHFLKIDGEWKLHREDGPAVEYTDGYQAWYLDGKLHREDGPAIEWADGDKDWYLNGLRHREDGPAMERAGSRKEWYLNGKLHREDGPAIEWDDGGKQWYLNGVKMTQEEFEKTRKTKIEQKDGTTHYFLKIDGEWKLHREDGPAIEDVSGYKAWYLNGGRHREDGPARERADGYKEWYLNDTKLTQKEFEAKMKSPTQSNICLNKELELSVIEQQKKDLLMLLDKFGYQPEIFSEYAKLLQIERKA